MQAALDELRLLHRNAEKLASEYSAAIRLLTSADQATDMASEVRPQTLAEPTCGEKYPLGLQVSLRLSGEKGTVIGFAHYLRQPPQFYVEYLGADGRHTEGWFATEQLRTE